MAKASLQFILLVVLMLPGTASGEDLFGPKDSGSSYNEKRALVERYLDEVKQDRRGSDRYNDSQSEPSERGIRRSREVTSDYVRDYANEFAPSSEISLVAEDTPRAKRRAEKEDRDYLKGFRLERDDFIRAYQTPTEKINSYERRKPASEYLKSRNQPSMEESKKESFSQISESRAALLKVKNLLSSNSRRLNSNSPLASLEDEEENSSSSDKLLRFRASLLTGVTSATNSNTAIQTQRLAEQQEKNFYMGLGLDLGVGNYLGAEVEGFLGLSSPATLVDSSGTEIEKNTQQQGFLGNIRTQLPVNLGSFEVVPSIGIGYGLLSIKETAKVAQGELVSEAGIMGPFWTVGLVFNPKGSFILTADYASSFGATAKVGSIAGIFSYSNAGCAYSRLRVGAHVRLWEHVLLGAQYAVRKASIQSDTTAVQSTTGTNVADRSESLNQFLGSLSFEF